MIFRLIGKHSIPDMNILKSISENGKIIYLLSAVILILTSVFSLGYFHFDEHFQILEFAGLKLDLTTPENLPWEYHYQMRPSVQPLIVVCLYRLLSLFGISSPFAITFLLRLLSAAFSFSGFWLLYNVYSNSINDRFLQKWYLLLSFFLWFLIFISVRFSSENWSGVSFIIAFALYLRAEKHNFILCLFVGLFLGFSFITRYQAGFLTAGFLAWIMLVRREKLTNVFALIAGIIFIVFLGILSDRWFYGEWTLTSWNYFEANILQDRISGFGIKPWYYYIETFFVKGIPPFSLLFILSLLIILVFERTGPITWSILPFLVIHFMIGHKEMRFLFPVAGLLPVIVIKAMDVVQRNYVKDLTANKYFQLFMKVFFIVNFMLLLFISFRTADQQVRLYRKIYYGYTEQTTLYYFNENPYLRVLDIQFYKRKNLEIKQIISSDSIRNIPGRTELIVLSGLNEHPEFEEHARLVYTSYPGWIVRLNFNDWLSRSAVWRVYELYK